MKVCLKFALFILCLTPQISSMEPAPRIYKLTKVLVNNNPEGVQISYNEPDNGFTGRHALRNVNYSLPPGSRLTVTAYSKQPNNIAILLTLNSNEFTVTLSRDPNLTQIYNNIQISSPSIE